jgi:hypothetical protein
MVSVVRSEGAMRKALEDKFGTNYTPALPNRPLFSMSFGQESLDAADVEVQGTNAIIHRPGRNDRSDEIRMVKIDGIWKLSGHKGDSPPAITGMESMERVSSGVDTFTAEVANGEFRTAEEALRAMRQRVGPMMSGRR